MGTKPRVYSPEFSQFVRDCLVYDPRSPSGLIWTAKISRKVVPGTPALACTGRNGYYTGRVQGQQVYAHRVVWFLVTGIWPSLQIDHLDGVRTNNVVSNLREVGQNINAKNMVRLRTNTTGLAGLFFDKRDQRFYAGYCVNGKRVNIKSDGTLFDTAANLISSRNREGNFTTRHGRQNAQIPRNRRGLA